MDSPIITERLILRKFQPEDAEAMFELDSNPAVHTYLGNNPMQTMDQARDIIKSLLSQYEEHGIGRWAAIEKSSGKFIGWSGLKFMTDPINNRSHYYDVGYRFIPQFWGKGYATESAKAALEYGFTKMNMQEIVGTVSIENHASRRALEKCGLTFVEKFMWRDIPCDWLKITRTEWENMSATG